MIPPVSRRPLWYCMSCGRLAATVLFGMALASGTARAEEVVITEKARAHFRTGVNMLQDPDGARYAEAYREFKAAYEDSPSWKILGNLGITAMKLERDGEAISAFRKYLEEGGSQLTPSERAQVERDLETLEVGVVWVTVQTVPGGVRLTDTRVPVAGRPVVNRYALSDGPLRIGLHPGAHTLLVEADGYESQEWTFEAEPGSIFDKLFELKPSQTAQPESTLGTPPVGVADRGVHRPVPTSVYVSLTAAGVLAVGGAVTGVLALGKQRDFEDANRGIASDADRQRAAALRDQGETLNLATDILLGSALVAGGAAAFFYFTRPEEKVTTSASLSLSPSALPGGGGLWMYGTF